MKINERKPVKIDTSESAGLMKLHFTALTAGVPTGNGRRYPANLVKKFAGEFNERIRKYGPVMGSTGHPKEGMEVEDVATMINAVNFNEDTQGLEVDATVLPTSKGRSVKSIILAGGKIGASVAGVGDVNPDGEVKEFKLNRVDLVLNPAQDNFVGMNNVYESLEIPDSSMDEIVETRYREAVKAGFSGDLNDYRKVYAQWLEESKKTGPIGEDKNARHVKIA